MEYTIFLIVPILGLLLYVENQNLKKKIKNQEERIDKLCELTGNDNLSSNWVSSEVKKRLVDLKKDGKTVEAVKLLRDKTQMSLLEAKEYIDKLDQYNDYSYRILLTNMNNFYNISYSYYYSKFQKLTVEKPLKKLKKREVTFGEKVNLIYERLLLFLNHIDKQGFVKEIIDIIGGVDLNNNKYNGLERYLVFGMIIGLFIGVVFSLIMRNNTFFAISSPGFGLSLGLLIADITWCIKKWAK